MIKDFYRLIYNQNGKVVSIHDAQTGASLSYDPSSKTFDELDPLTTELRVKEAELGALDLSDRLTEPQPLLKNYRLNFLVESDRAMPLFRYPGDVNYDTGLVVGLSTKTIDYFGLRVANICEQILDTETLEPLPNPLPIVYERYKYLWNETTELPTSRVKEIQFYFEDGTLDPRKKLLPKEFYNTSDKENITYQRRKTIVSWLVARSKELGLGTALEGFFSNFKNECDRYILYGDLSILDLVNASTEPWMNADTTTTMGTVRNAIATCFDKALEPTSNQEIAAFLSEVIGYYEPTNNN